MKNQPDLVSSDDMNYFLDEISQTKNRETFNCSMKRFEESFIHRYNSANPQKRGAFPFGCDEYGEINQNPLQISQPFSYLGSFYQGEPQRLHMQTENIRRIEEPYSKPMYERGQRNEPPRQTIIRTEYVPYPYPLHPPTEYNYTIDNHTVNRRNPLRESMELRKVKEELFNQSLGGGNRNTKTPPVQDRLGGTIEGDNKGDFKSFYNRKF